MPEKIIIEIENLGKIKIQFIIIITFSTVGCNLTKYLLSLY